MKREGVIALITGLAATLIISSSCSAQESRQSPKQQKQSGNDTCGTTADLAFRIEVCARPLMDLIEGTAKKWPRVDSDMADLCVQFVQAEKCIRDNGRKCAKGIHKTIITTLANSVQRVRKRECLPAKYTSLVKTTMCSERNQEDLHKMVSNVTSHLKVIETKMPDLDKKTTAVCCMVNTLEDDLRRVFVKKCPEELVIVLRLYRGILEDVRELICRKPKCGDTFRGFQVVITDDIKGIVAIILRIVFSLGN